MNSAHQNPRVISLCADQKLLDGLKECNKLLDQVRRARDVRKGWDMRGGWSVRGCEDDRDDTLLLSAVFGAVLE